MQVIGGEILKVEWLQRLWHQDVSWTQISMPDPQDMQLPDRIGERKERLGQCGHAVAQEYERLAPAPPVAQHAGKHLGDGDGRFGDAFKKADGSGACRRVVFA